MARTTHGNGSPGSRRGSCRGDGGDGALAEGAVCKIQPEGWHVLDFLIGIHVERDAAGVIGEKKFSYDL
jgi:hypothetical protein